MDLSIVKDDKSKKILKEISLNLKKIGEKYDCKSVDEISDGIKNELSEDPIIKDTCLKMRNYIPKTCVSEYVEHCNIIKNLISEELSDKVNDSPYIKYIIDNIFNRMLVLCKNEARVNQNHNILLKRFKLDSSISRLYESYKHNTEYVQYYEIISNIDTYNLPIDQKICVIAEELMFIYNMTHPVRKYGEFHDAQDEILFCVFSYMYMVMYNNMDINTLNSIITKDIDTLKDTIGYFNSEDDDDDMLEKCEYIKTFVCSSDVNLCYNAIKNIQAIGDINKPGNFLEIIKSVFITQYLKEKEILRIINLIYLNYTYGKFSDTDTMNIIKDFLIYLVAYCNSNYVKGASLHSIFLNGLISLKVELAKNNHKEFNRVINTAISMAMKEIEKVDLINKPNNPEEDKPADDDDTSVVEKGITEYDIKLIDKIKDSKELFDGCVLDKDALYQSVAKPEVLIQLGPNFIKLLTSISINNQTQLSTDECIQILRNAYNKCDDVSMASSLSECIRLLEKNNKNNMMHNEDDGKDFYESAIESGILNIHKCIKDIDDKLRIGRMISSNNETNSVIDYVDDINKREYPLYEEVSLLNAVSNDIIHEMKIGSYLTLAVDRAKKAYDTFDDKQKSFFNNLDRTVRSIEDWGEKEDSDEAREKIVRNKILPTMSRCIKTVLLVGAASLINIYLGIVILGVKLVSSRKALAKERQAIADELEVELEMIDKRISDKSDAGDRKSERNLRLLKKRLQTQYARIKVDNDFKWNKQVKLKDDIEDAGERYSILKGE